MDKNEITKLLCELHTENVTDSDFDLDEYFNKRFLDVTTLLNIDFDDIQETIFSFLPEVYQVNEQSHEWKYVATNIYLIHLLSLELDRNVEDLLSVQQSKDIRNCLGNLVTIGILQNIIPTIPFYTKLNSKQKSTEEQYCLLKIVVLSFYQYLKRPNLRLLILPHSLQGILTGMYQLGYCPVKKPSNTEQEPNFVMTQGFYHQVIKDQERFKSILENLRISIHPAIFIKETMILFHSKMPSWFKKAVSSTLTNVINTKTGLVCILRIMIDGAGDDITRTWKTLEVVTKIMLNCRKSPDFLTKIYPQIVNLLDVAFTANSPNDSLVFERMFATFTKGLYVSDQVGGFALINHVFENILQFSKKEITSVETLLQSIRVLNFLFVDNNSESPEVPINLIESMLPILFRFFALFLDSDRIAAKNELRELLEKYLKNVKESSKMFATLDDLLFGIEKTDLYHFSRSMVLNVNSDSIEVAVSEFSVSYPLRESAEALHTLGKANLKLSTTMFEYLINCLRHSQKYFKSNNLELLELETETLETVFEKKLVVYDLLSKLSSCKEVQENIIENPHEIITYIDYIFHEAIQNGVHTGKNKESDAYQNLFLATMILYALLENSDHQVKSFDAIKVPLRTIRNETSDEELRQLMSKISNCLDSDDVNVKRTETKSSLDQAIEDAFDECLPVKGHGLLALTKLIKNRDKDALGRRQYLLNVFQENLKHKDTYIYLGAINGIASLAEEYTSIVLSELCAEYSNFPTEEFEKGNELRMKIGEVLVQTTKILNELAPKYKSLLLNTFLEGTKDDDHLMRASSLSNLGEICRVLGYKLGTIVAEVLVCVHAIITTDKAVEARRAAVTVMRQLFVGLGCDTLNCLKEEILPIYRSLKLIYNDDADDVMRLQAQLALEQLNDNMKEIVFPKVQFSFNKKILVLK